MPELVQQDVADGAAAVLLTRADLLPKDHPYPLVRIAASAQASDTIALHDRSDPLFLEAIRISVAKALEQANISIDQVNFLEYHDSYSIYAALSLEAAGFALRGSLVRRPGRGGIGGALPAGGPGE